MKTIVAALFLAFLGVARAAPLWVRITRDGHATSSRDGKHWEHDAALEGKFGAVTYGEGRFVAVGDRIAVSTDGTTWRDAGAAPAVFEAIAFGQSKFVAVAGEQLWQSNDGEHFATVAKRAPLPYFHCHGLACGDTEAGFCFVAVGALPDGDSFSFWQGVSTTGETWDLRFATGVPIQNDVAYGGGHFLTVSHVDFATTHDGITWVKQAPPAREIFHRALWTGDRFLVKGKRVWTSPDGEKWTPAEPGFDPWGERLAAVAIGEVP